MGKNAKHSVPQHCGEACSVKAFVLLELHDFQNDIVALLFHAREDASRPAVYYSGLSVGVSNAMLRRYLNPRATLLALLSQCIMQGFWCRETFQTLMSLLSYSYVVEERLSRCTCT